MFDMRSGLRNGRDGKFNLSPSSQIFKKDSERCYLRRERKKVQLHRHWRVPCLFSSHLIFSLNTKDLERKKGNKWEVCVGKTIEVTRRTK